MNRYCRRFGRPCCCMDSDGKVVKTFSSRTAAARWVLSEKSVSWRYQRISSCCEGVEPTAFGYSWEYIDENFQESRAKSLVGQRFGSLTVAKALGLKASDGSQLFACKCDCGSVRVYSVLSLASGNTQSCGCLDSVRLLEDAIREASKVRTEIRSEILGGVKRETVQLDEYEGEF